MSEGQIELSFWVTNVDAKIEAFKNREVKAKNTFVLSEIDKAVAYKFIAQYHYLKDAKFFAKYCYGIFIDNVLVGCATYSNPQGIVAMKSWFGLENDNQDVLELSRLCMLPKLNGTNATSYLLGNSLRLLKSKQVKAVITLADDSRHVGSIYQVCNFKYYGLTDKKTDFYTTDGRTNPRGQTKDIKVHSEPYSREMAQEGLDWITDIKSRTSAPAPEKSAFFCKNYCAWYDQSGKVGCVGK
jgi:hypothetical protein